MNYRPTMKEVEGALRAFIASGSANGREEFRRLLLRSDHLLNMARAVDSALPYWCVIRYDGGTLTIEETLVGGSSRVYGVDGKPGRILEMCGTKEEAQVKLDALNQKEYA